MKLCWQSRADTDQVGQFVSPRAARASHDDLRFFAETWNEQLADLLNIVIDCERKEGEFSPRASVA
jgi:hypothetical protein